MTDTKPGQRPEGDVRSDADRLRRNRQDELDNATVYAAMAAVESRPELARVYQRLSETELRHFTHWENALREAGEPVPPRRPSWRARMLARLARRFGAAFVLPTLAASEQANQNAYGAQPEAAGTPMVAEERSHALLLSTIAGSAQGMEGPMLARLEGRHRAIGGNALRAAVLGANDGLVSNLSLVMGVAGAALSNRTILITGLAGLVAGAFSMAMGEWVSVQSSRELYERQIAVEAEEIATFPKEEADELALVYQAKGLTAEDAHRLAAQIMSDQSRALDTMAREELGIDPQELGGSAWTAAASSFALFCAGAITPVIPFTFLSGASAVITSLLLSALALFAIGAAITLVTSRSALYSGVRQLFFGLAAAGVTFGIGSLINATVV